MISLLLHALLEELCPCVASGPNPPPGEDLVVGHDVVRVRVDGPEDVSESSGQAQEQAQLGQVATAALATAVETEFVAQNHDLESRKNCAYSSSVRNSTICTIVLGT